MPFFGRVKQYLVLLFFIFSSFCFAEDLQLRWYNESESLVNYADYLEDPHSEYSLEEIQSPALQSQFKPLRQQDVNRGITRSTFWLKLNIRNPRDNGVTWAIHPETSYIDNIEVWVKRTNGNWRHQKRSDDKKFGDRDIKYRFINATFRITSKEREEVYIKISTNRLEPVNIQLYITGQTNLRDLLAKEYMYYGIYYGLFIALALIAICIWTYAQDRSIKYIVFFLGYLSSNILMWLSINGFSFQFLWPSNPWLHNEGLHITYLCVSMFSFLFTREILNTKEHHPVIDKIIKAFVVVCVFAVTLRLVGYYEPVMYIALACLFLMAAQPILGWISYRDGRPYLLFFVIAWVPYSISLLFTVASTVTTWSAIGMTTLLFTQLSVLFEFLMLIFATLGRMQYKAKKLSELTLQDPLTKLGNRRRLETYLEELKRNKTNDKEYWLLLVDIDFFKRINDVFGHAVGDDVIVLVSDILKNACRTTDVAVRWGGEEFILLINVESEKQAFMVAERVRETYCNTPLNLSDPSVPHSLSVGINKLNVDSHYALKDATEGADKALYQAKSSGRNRCVIYSEDSDEHVLQT